VLSDASHETHITVHGSIDSPNSECKIKHATLTHTPSISYHKTEHSHSHHLTLFYLNPTVASIAMRIVDVPSSRSNSIDIVQLEHANMVFDPRIIVRWMDGYNFRFSDKGRTLTITRIDADDEGWYEDFKLRAYLPTEDS